MEIMTAKQYLPGDRPYFHSLIHNRALIRVVHVHEFYEIMLVISGTAHNTLNGREDILGAGDIVFITPSDVHQCGDSSAELDLLSLQIAVPEMERFLAAYGLGEMLCHPQRSRFFTFSASETRSISEVCGQMIAQSEVNVVRLYRIMLGRIMQCFLIHAMQENTPAWLRLAMEQMRSIRNAAEGVPALLRLSNISHAQLCRLMKKYCGVTPQQYVRDVRLGLACRMIEDSDTDFMTISMEVGYNSFSHFYGAFKEKYGMSPSELRHQASLRLQPLPESIVSANTGKEDPT